MLYVFCILSSFTRVIFIVSFKSDVTRPFYVILLVALLKANRVVFAFTMTTTGVLFGSVITGKVYDHWLFVVLSHCYLTT